MFFSVFLRIADPFANSWDMVILKVWERFEMVVV